ncbi:PREDICTED: uncharacterized calcium-binding protein At1g02270-like [Camelina sativa]|uniref:Uncharacterized calcium-binding protein At1g02270-like n=1 Tax=Camelina sativa TaxID=90675 RepID=A0ABM0VGM1_CAMSA|nr:PREDICTED: uncharacterized calcium-binding protein At1g02270-like [Camelina sativa]
MQSHQQPCISCTTFNILAPIYKRLSPKDQSLRESDNRTYWLGRNHRIIDWLLYERSSIICLQEFWVGNEELVNMYEKRLGDAGYLSYKLGRTNNRGDESYQKEGGRREDAELNIKRSCGFSGWSSAYRCHHRCFSEKIYE